MSLQDDIVTVLTANAPLVTLATGGIIAYDTLRGYGLNAKSYPAGYDANLRLKYVVVVRERDQVPTSQITGGDTQAHSFLHPVEIGFFADRALLYSVIESMQQTIYGLLEDRNVGSSYTRMRWARNGRMDRAYTLDNAIACYSLYDGSGILTP